ncbi:hypothetical protein CPB84DRAFT_1141596 [Gymnopilus junonius]|uniref:Uncharacterized protein n=1 Tax=Gymnopilus junonius TaxID=109634 RepID=A0A9P5NJP1_GYMJU|nr:hypothetical protein CPB84DRAFT_1141596 [Gymnopilus junonius]
MAKNGSGDIDELHRGTRHAARGWIMIRTGNSFLIITNIGRGAFGLAIYYGPPFPWTGRYGSQSQTQLSHAICELTLGMMMVARAYFLMSYKPKSDDVVVEPSKKLEVLKVASFGFTIIFYMHLFCWCYFFVPYICDDWKAFRLAAETPRIDI